MVLLEKSVLGQPLRWGVEVKLEVLKGHESEVFAVDEGGELAFPFGVEADAVFSGVDEILAFVELVAKGSEE